MTVSLCGSQEILYALARTLSSEACYKMRGCQLSEVGWNHAPYYGERE